MVVSALQGHQQGMHWLSLLWAITPLDWLSTAWGSAFQRGKPEEKVWAEFPRRSALRTLASGQAKQHLALRKTGRAWDSSDLLKSSSPC